MHELIKHINVHPVVAWCLMVRSALRVSLYLAVWLAFAVLLWVAIFFWLLLVRL